MTGVECDLVWRVGTRGNGSEDVLPNGALAPACETVVDGVVRSILSRAVFPATSGLLDMHDASQYSSSIMGAQDRADWSADAALFWTTVRR